MIAVCSGAYRMSKRQIEELVSDFFGVEMSLGSVSNLEAATSEAMAAPHEEAMAHVQRAQIVHADETTWAQSSKLAWLWTAVTRTVAVFIIRTSRSAAVAQELLGKRFAGFLVADRYQGYHWLMGRRRQLCWAHLIRNFRALLEWPVAKTFGERLLDFSERLFSQWHRVRDGTCLRTEFLTALTPLQQEFSQLLLEGMASPHPRVRAMCKMLRKHEPSLWTFTCRSGIEPTNNRAERALRHAVLWRKSSFGTDSERGSRFVERMLTAVMTLRLQRRNVLDFITDACNARRLGLPAPSLLPGA
jgi:transposase